LTRFAELVDASERVAANRARSVKIATLADVLRLCDPAEVPIAVAVLSGEARQGRIGVGWRTLMGVDAAPAAEPSLSITDVDDALTQLQAAVGAGSQQARRALLHALFSAATEAEKEFLVRLLGGEVRQGALAGLMIDAVAKASGVPVATVRRACMLAGELPEVAGRAMTGGEEALAAIGLDVLRPVLPMLASTATGVDDAMAAIGRASVEWKLDGVRVQAHRRGDDVRLFTRNQNDVTDRLPALVQLMRELPSDAVILDGEVLGIGGEEDLEQARPDEFQSTMSRFGRHEGGGHGLIVRFFDCIHLDGADLLDEPLSRRQDALERVAALWRIPAVVTDDTAVAASVLEQALALGHEGVMVKAIDSRYEAGRRGQAWRKVKPVHTFDLVVLGAEWGHGRRQGWLSNLHLGARHPDDGFVMVGKTFKGLTDELLTWQTEQFLARETGREGIVVWVTPDMVVEVAIDGVQRSPRYPGGVALRFARVRRYRPDKDAADADTIDTVRALLAGA
jgi:DNA ligase-1